MKMWKLVMPVSLLAVGTVMGSAAPSYAGAFGGTYSFTSNAVSVTTETGDASSPNRVDFSSFGGDGTAVGSNFDGTSWSDTKFFSFSAIPTAGNNITSLTGFSFKSTSDSTVNNGSGPNAWKLFYSGNGGSTFSEWVGGNLTRGAEETIPLTSTTLTLTRNIPILFRLYGLGSVGAGNNNGKAWTVDDVELRGTAEAIPTPAAIPAMVGFGLGLWRKRKKAEVA
jgi:hypothetical protein